ncbi:hypothetical protein V8F20_003664 [Naviculisporaceae sp. PSN 640]
MAKRSLESASPSPAPERPIPAPAERQAARRNDRSHEENQERAYIAASRRADRSLEARVQSARMASEIHKKRTGKGFRITEDIVMREEMYEEEEDEMPRHYRAFAAHLNSTSSDMNNRVNAYVTNQVALASIARHREVDKLFAEHFPMAAQHAAQLQHSGQSLASFQFPSNQYPRVRTHSTPDAMSPLSPYQPANPSYRRSSTQHSSPIDDQPANMPYRPSSSRHTSIDEQMSFVASRTPITNYSGEDVTTKQPSSVPVDPSLTIPGPPNDQPPSSFTTELPGETRMLLGADINDQIMSAMYAGELMGSEDYFGPSEGPMPSYSMHLPYGQSIAIYEPPPTGFDLPESQSQGTHIGQPFHASGGGQPSQASGGRTPSGHVGQPSQDSRIGQPLQVSGGGTPSCDVNFGEWLTDPESHR